jgi:uncharacterized surface protein with fasciclin (FAS1) repeats
MYKFFKSLKMCVVAVLALLATSCDHDNLLVPKPNENIRPAADFIKNNYDFRLFYAALEYTGLIAELNGKGPFTVLAIPDNGFNSLGITAVDQIGKLNKDSLRHALQYHVLQNRKLLTADVPTNAVDVRYETLAGESIYASSLLVGKDYFFNGARATRTDITLANGIMHVLNKFMQYHKGQTVQQHLAADTSYSIFVSGLKKFGLWDELSGKVPFTVFAPENSAFTTKGITAETINSLDTNGYYGIRLFGAYIMYDNRFFISDQYVFKGMGGEYTYQSTLRNDTWYTGFGTDLQSANPSDGFYTPYPALTLWKPVPGGLPVIIGSVMQNTSSLKPLVYYDHLCENGIVHRLHGVLALPADAAK